MKCNFFLYAICAPFLFCTKTIQAQTQNDVIYLENMAPVSCAITNVSKEAVTYRKEEGAEGEGAQYQLPVQEVLLLFQSNGDFMIPSMASDLWIKGANPGAHLIVTPFNQILHAQSVEIRGDKIIYQDGFDHKNHEINKKNVLIIIFKNGDHQIFAPVDEVVAELKQVANEMHSYTVSGAAGTTINASDTTANASDIYLQLNNRELRRFRDKALQKASDLGRYLSLISNKNKSEEDKQYAINAALDLFVNDSARVEVSSLNREVKEQFYIREYLERLRYLPYDKVELIWINAQLVSRFRKGKDDKYYGIITAQQLFRGFLENEIVYQDVTEKNVEVVLDKYEVFDEGVKKKNWDVFLSDISVQQTREK